MSWNQGNGNNGYGNQQGYGQQQYGGDVDDVYGRMNNAREQGGARFPFIEAGRHKLALCTLEKFMHRNDGACARVLFKVLESNAHQPGSFVVKIYKLLKQPKFDSQASDAEQLAQLCIALKDAPRGYPIGNDIRVLLEERPAEQLARGTVVECTGVQNKKGNWVNLYWNPIAQTPENIVAMRQRIEAEGVPATTPQQQGTQGGQFNAALHSSRMQQQYPAQQGYPVQPQMPQQQVAQYPSAMPQQAAPQGGFLAQLPPQGAPMQQAPQQGYVQQGGPVQGPQGANGGGRPW
jgi:hypothetical protein